MAETQVSDATRKLGQDGTTELDAVVIGAGFAGLYMLYRLREAGLSAKVLEAGSGIGGTWFWNRYPGARCDVESLYYSFGFDPSLEQEWQWTERYPAQAEILSYINHVADRYELWPGIVLNSRVAAASYDEDENSWEVVTEAGECYRALYCVMATGSISRRKAPDFPGVESFAGETYFTSEWPSEGVDLAGKRVGVVGTGSTGVQVIPEVARRAKHLTVFQRTANFSLPARNAPLDPAREREVKAEYRRHRREQHASAAGVPVEPGTKSALEVSDQEFDATLSPLWDAGKAPQFMSVYSDIAVDAEANERVAEWVRGKIREIVDDPEVAELLCACDHPIGTKRICLDTEYFETYNRDNVSLVDVRSDPIRGVVPAGIETSDGKLHELDVIVYAIGFDAMTGALLAIDPVGRTGTRLSEVWDEGPRALYGLAVAGFPNLFTITGPGSPSVLSNMIVSIEQHVDWITACIGHLGEQRVATIEADQDAQDRWVDHVRELADATLFVKANSWYLGANVPGKPRVFMPYIGGVATYKGEIDRVAAAGYAGFLLDGEAASDCGTSGDSDLHPQAKALLEQMEAAGMPHLYEQTPVEARENSALIKQLIGDGPPMHESFAVSIPADGGSLEAVVHRPTAAPRGTIVYYHGGGWVVGSSDTTEATLQLLARDSGFQVVGVDYRLAPEHRFPVAVADARAAFAWVAENLEFSEPLVLAGDSAGGNLAAVTARWARDNEGPAVAAQVLVYPVTDSAMDTDSYERYADVGLPLGRREMEWFWDHYLPDPAARRDPDASPLRAESLAGLPPALVICAGHDPLRDETLAYAKALDAAGVSVEVVRYEDVFHGFFTMPNALDRGNEAIALAASFVRELPA